MDELDTPTFRTLINRSDSVFLEFVSPNLDGSRELERDLNEYIKTGEMPIKLRECYDYQIECQGETGYDFFIANLTQRTQKRIVLEKTLSAPFYFNEENDNPTVTFVNKRKKGSKRSFSCFNSIFSFAFNQRDRDYFFGHCGRLYLLSQQKRSAEFHCH